MSQDFARQQMSRAQQESQRAAERGRRTLLVEQQRFQAQQQQWQQQLQARRRAQADEYVRRQRSMTMATRSSCQYCGYQIRPTSEFCPRCRNAVLETASRWSTSLAPHPGPQLVPRAKRYTGRVIVILLALLALAVFGTCHIHGHGLS
jgi:predicted Zn-ribbon and HTH transcriptional regulator